MPFVRNDVRCLMFAEICRISCAKREKKSVYFLCYNHSINGGCWEESCMCTMCLHRDKRRDKMQNMCARPTAHSQMPQNRCVWAVPSAIRFNCIFFTFAMCIDRNMKNVAVCHGDVSKSTVVPAALQPLLSKLKTSKFHREECSQPLKM